MSNYYLSIENGKGKWLSLVSSTPSPPLVLEKKKKKRREGKTKGKKCLDYCCFKENGRKRMGLHSLFLIQLIVVESSLRGVSLVVDKIYNGVIPLLS
jgi:hypothetical protein